LGKRLANSYYKNNMLRSPKKHTGMIKGKDLANEERKWIS
jgi:hypothetical protein